MEVFTIYKDSLLKKAMFFTRNLQDAQDLVQDVAVKMILYNLESKPPDEQIKICRRAIVNQFYDNEEKRKAEKKRLRNYCLHEHVEPAVEIKMELEEVMGTMHNKLGVNATSLYAIAYGYSVKEIGNALDIKRNAVLSRIYRGREMLTKKTNRK